MEFKSESRSVTLIQKGGSGVTGEGDDDLCVKLVRHCVVAFIRQ